MSSPSKQQQQQAQKKAGWGSLFSGAVAGLESRLDTILADDGEASARARAAEEAVKQAKRTNAGNLAPPSRSASTTGSRDTSRSRVNDRLAERLAKATASKPASRTASGAPSRVGSPAIADAVRTSGDLSRSTDITRSVPDIDKPAEVPDEQAGPDLVDGEKKDDREAAVAENGTLASSLLPINPARLSADSSRPSIEISRDDASSRQSLDLPNGSANSRKGVAELEDEMSQMRGDHAQAERQRQEEMHTYLEKIDALQGKLQYLAKETVAAAKEANASTLSGGEDGKLAEKDEKIALLMEEGEKLSKIEFRHTQTIKKLRAKASEDERAAAEVKRRLEKLERSESELKARLRQAEVAERQANEKTKQISIIETQVEELRVDRENASELIRNLTTQLKETKEKADTATHEANSKAAEIDMNRIASLENELEDAQIEKKLAEDRAQAETRKVREEAEGDRQRFGVREIELKNEIAGLESRVEAMRSRAEEATSEGNAGGDGSVQLMRQIETLQSQYSLAKENWESIDNFLNARVAALEKERDETTSKETEVRKKARDAGVRARKAEEEIESASERARALNVELESQKDEIGKLHAKLEQLEAAMTDAQADFARRRKLWETELQQRIEEERVRWQRETLAGRNGLPVTFPHKTSLVAEVGTHSSRRPGSSNRVISHHDLATINTDQRSQRRGSAFPTQGSAPISARPHSNSAVAPSPLDRSSEVSPTLSRQESSLSLDTPTASNIPPTPSLELDNDFEGSDFPQKTINDLVSTSATTSTGPSVQLVERMSAAVRRLESEKAAFKDELMRLSSQRDSAREEVVTLMREVEVKRNAEKRSSGLENEMSELKGRHEASLELLGEREEEVEELKQDVEELKRLYRELVEDKMGSNKK